ncbi:hypothetical protein GCK32_004925 [Trichostrongylus colubriformis]|uniref:Uncharacterized protein n=1 Tax=Trichostrongylus colubriformis TaxID=6319 RepID=A0AAN8IVH3_TRICO
MGPVGPNFHIHIKELEMPMDPTDAMWMSKAPTVSELVGTANITFKPVVPAHNDERIRPDFDTDVLLWKPNRISLKQRTMSVGSSDSEGLRISMESSRSNSISSPIDVPRPRKLSLSERLFGSPSGAFSWGQASSISSTLEEKREPISEDARFKDFMKHQNKVLGDDGFSSFKKRDYMK